jgi:hypothetical protein
MASHLGPGKFHPLTVAGASNLAAYAVAADDGTTRLALIEKTPTGGTLPVTVALGHGSGAAQVIHLTGPSLTAPSGVQIQGASVDREGHLRPGDPDRVSYPAGTLSLTLPTGSAALVTFGEARVGPPPDGGAPAVDAEPIVTAPDGPAPSDPDAAIGVDAGSAPAMAPPRPRSGGCQLGGSARPGLPLIALAVLLGRRRLRGRP